MAHKTKSTDMSGIRQKTHERVDKIMDRAESMRESSKEAIAGLKGKGVEMKGDLDGYIRKNPEKSVLIAAGIGAVVGALVLAALMRKR